MDDGSRHHCAKLLININHIKGPGLSDKSDESEIIAINKAVIGTTDFVMHPLYHSANPGRPPPLPPLPPLTMPPLHNIPRPNNQY